MLEVEQKFRVNDHAPIRAALAGMGATGGDERPESDQYFNAPDRDFAATGEAFRLRRSGESNILTYKGPKQAGPVKTRQEVELTIASGDLAARQATTLLTGLGYRPVAVVEKLRASYAVSTHGPMTVCLDTVRGVGSFVEVEMLADESSADAARQAVQKLAAALGLTELEPRSYLRMLLEGGS